MFPEITKPVAPELNGPLEAKCAVIPEENHAELSVRVNVGNGHRFSIDWYKDDELLKHSK